MTDIREICPVCDQAHSGDPYDGHDVRGLICQARDCNKSIVFPITRQGVGCFCSPSCADREAATREHERRTA